MRVRTEDEKAAPAAQSHFHQACQHWCFAYGCSSLSCQHCSRRDSNARMQAEYEAREARRLAGGD